MEFHITEDQKRALADDGIVKLPDLIDSGLLSELNECFEWSIAHPGPIASGKTDAQDHWVKELPMRWDLHWLKKR